MSVNGSNARSVKLAKCGFFPYPKPIKKTNLDQERNGFKHCRTKEAE